MEQNSGSCSMANQGSRNNFVMPIIKQEPLDTGYNCPNSINNFQIPHIKPEPVDTGYETNNTNSCIPNDCQGIPQMSPMENLSLNIKPEPVAPSPKKGRKKKVKTEIKQECITEHLQVKKKRDRFKGMTEEEVLTRVLPDHLKEGLDIAIIGINPGLTAAFVGHHYAGPGNHFWKCLLLSGLITEPLNAYDDHRLLEFGIGFTNIVERTSRGSADLSRKEIKEGGEILTGKIQKFRPRIAVFNGKGIYEVFCGHKKFAIGKQPDPFPGCPETAVFVMPSSSARFTQLPRAIDKVPFYVALKKFRDHLRGDLQKLDETEICFPDLDLKVKVKQEIKQEGEEGQVKEKPKRTRKRRSKGANEEVPPKIKTEEEIMSQSMPNMYQSQPGQQNWSNHMMGPNFLPPVSVKQEPGVQTPGMSVSYQEPNVANQHPYWNSLSYSTPRPQTNMNQPFQVKQENTNDYNSYGLMSGNNGANCPTPMGQSWPSMPNPNVTYPFVTVGQNFFVQPNSASTPHVVSQSGTVTHGFNPHQSSQSLSSSLNSFANQSTPTHSQGPNSYSAAVSQHDSAINLSASQPFSPVSHSSPINSNQVRHQDYSCNNSALNLTTNQTLSPAHQSTPINSQPSVQPQPPKQSSRGHSMPSQNSPMPGLSPPQPQTQIGNKTSVSLHSYGDSRNAQGMAHSASDVRAAINASFQY